MKDIKYIIFRERFKWKVLLILLFIGFSISAQIDTVLINTSTPRQLKKLGKNALRQNDPGTAINFFEAYLKWRKSDPSALYMTAQCYHKIGDYQNAQDYYLKAYNTKSEKTASALYYYAQMQKSNGKYDSAKVSFQKFKKEYKGDERQLKKQSVKEILFCDSVQKIFSIDKKIIVAHLDTTINKVNTEAAPLNIDENTMIFSSLRTEKIEYSRENDTAAPVNRKLYYAKRTGETWKFAGEYGSNLNLSGYNTGNACFSPDRKRIYFTRCKPNSQGQMICAIYVSEKQGEEWTEPVKLPKTINDPKYTSTMPAVTADPLKGNDIVYFVSNNKLGKGGMDIWYTIYDKKNQVYKTPKNAGNKINTPSDEISPFFDNETRTLYFSSQGWNGLGGFDVYKGTGDGKKWLGNENVGVPINSGADDVYYTISPNREEGFFISNRKGGNTLKNKACCDDIYRYKHTEYIKVNLDGYVYDSENPTLGVSNATVEVYIKDKGTKEKALVKTVITDNKGNYKTGVEAGQEYVLIIKKKDFLGASVDVNTTDFIVSQEIKRTTNLTREPKGPIHIPNIQYEFGKSDILESSKTVIDTTVLTLMNANPEVIVEIQSHTDDKGNEQFNQKLSQKRAESVVNYLLSKGINTKRLVPKGYGESKPIAPNENADHSDNPEGRAKNRRTDFKIIGKLDVEVINDSEVD